MTPQSIPGGDSRDDPHRHGDVTGPALQDAAPHAPRASEVDPQIPGAGGDGDVVRADVPGTPDVITHQGLLIRRPDDDRLYVRHANVLAIVAGE